MKKFGVLMTGLVVFCVGWIMSSGSAFAHNELTPQTVQEYKASGTMEERKGRIAMLKQFRLSEGVEQRAVYKVRRAALEAGGLSSADAARALTGGVNMAFPYAADTELRAKGTVKTLTVLIDFKDHRASERLPNLKTDAISANIYGEGTPLAQTSFKPHESVRAYYRRASQNKVEVNGTVLSWHNFFKDRKQYEPIKAPASLPLQQRRQQQALNDNTAIFRMLSEALGGSNASHNYAQYDNDGDGDIDLVTILYAGPNTGWGSFWWAYRWEFFTPEAASKTFGGKKVKQFVFQFVETRGQNADDYDPTTLLHEMGHAFGLADYYDYDPETGPQGGVGGLDMMHANKGNQNAFSRWLLDWIKPVVIGSGGMSVRTLVASSSEQAGDKAIAIFPGLADGIAPGQEMFILENRQRMGNDMRMPSDGLVIWHVDASVTSSGNHFAFDNSYTDRKLIRLVRADNPDDFRDDDSANAGTYFTFGKMLTPNSLPSSRDYTGNDTKISIDQISAPDERVSVRIGFLIGTSQGPLPGAAAAASTPLPNAAVASAPSPATALGSMDALLAGKVPLDLDVLEALDDAFSTASPVSLAGYWNAASFDNAAEHPETRSAVAKLLAARWATKDGAASASAVEQLAPDNRLRTEALPLVLKSWAKNAPSAAINWYLEDQRKALRGAMGANAVPFVREAFAGLYSVSREQALKDIQLLDSPAQIAAAVDGVVFAGSRLGQKHEAVTGRLYQSPSNVVKARIDVIRALRQAESKIGEPLRRNDVESLLGPPARQ